MFNVITILLILLTKCRIIYTLIDLNYCQNGLKSINKIDTDPHKFSFNVYMEDYYHARINDSKSLACCAPPGSTIKWEFQDKQLEKTDTTFKVVSHDQRYIQTTSISKYDFNSLNEINRYFQCFVTNKQFPQKILHQRFYVFPRNGGLKDLNHAKDRQRSYLLGKKTKLRCSLFLGYNSSVEPFVSVIWTSNSTEYFNESYLNRDGVKEVYTYSDGGDINYITVLNIKFDKEMWDQTFIFKCDFKINGTSYITDKYYVMPYKNPLKELKDTFTVTITSIVIVLFIIIVVGSVLLHFQIEIRLYWKDKFGRLEYLDGNDNDIFVCYNFNSDSHCVHSSFIKGTLVPYLEEILGYSCYDFIRDIKGGEYTHNTLLERIQKSRRLILILCDDLLKDNLCLLVCHTAITEALKRSLPIICILPHKSEGEKVTSTHKKLSYSLQTVLNVAYKVAWPRKEASSYQNKRFLNRICVHLPPRRHLNSYNATKAVVA